MYGMPAVPSVQLRATCLVCVRSEPAVLVNTIYSGDVGVRYFSVHFRWRFENWHPSQAYSFWVMVAPVFVFIHPCFQVRAR